MPTDRALYTQLLTRLHDVLGPTQESVGVALWDGVVTLNGYVTTASQKAAAEQAIAEIPGVHAIAEGLHIVGQSIRPLSDTSIAHALVKTLPTEVRGKPLHVMVRVEDGWATLTGTVPDQAAYAAVDHSIECVPGVRGATSEIHLEHPDGAQLVA